MIGRYRFFEGGELIAEHRNLITDIGREVILRYLSSDDPEFAETMMFGIGDNPAAANDELMHFEYHREEVNLKDYDAGDYKIIARATISDNMNFEISEVGLLVDSEISDDIFVGGMVTTFDPNDTAIWAGGDINDTDNKTDLSSFSLVLANNETRVLSREGSFGQFGEMVPQDEFSLAYNVISGSVEDIIVRFMVDSSNYREYQFSGQQGFSVESWNKADFTEVGSASWDEFERLEVEATAGASGGEILFEGLRTNRVYESTERLVSRSVLSEPIIKKGDSELQVQYIIDLNF